MFLTKLLQENNLPLIPAAVAATCVTITP